MPLTVRALKDSRVGFDHLVLLASTATAITRESVAAQEASYRASLRDRAAAGSTMAATMLEQAAAEPVPAVVFDEAALLALAESHSVSRFRHDCDHARHAGDPEGFLRDRLDAVDSRRLELLGAAAG